MYKASEAFRPEDIEAEGSGSSIIVSDVSSLAMAGFASRLRVDLEPEEPEGPLRDELCAYCSLAIMVLSWCYHGASPANNEQIERGWEGRLLSLFRYFSFQSR